MIFKDYTYDKKKDTLITTHSWIIERDLIEHEVQVEIYESEFGYTEVTAINTPFYLTKSEEEEILNHYGIF